MTCIKRRTLSLFLCVVLIFVMIVPASARASEYFHRTYVEVTHIGNGVLRIKLDLAATGTMQELGSTQVTVYKKDSNGNFVPVKTYTKEQYPHLVTYNRASYVAYITHPGSTGETYYAICAFYAKNANGSQILWRDSNTEDT